MVQAEEPLHFLQFRIGIVNEPICLRQIDNKWIAGRRDNESMDGRNFFYLHRRCGVAVGGKHGATATRIWHKAKREGPDFGC